MSRIFFLIFMSKFFWSFVQCGNLSYESFNDGCGKEESSCRQYSFFNSKKWLSQAFMEAESRFHIGEKASKSCQQDFNKLRQHLSINQISWAVRSMFFSNDFLFLFCCFCFCFQLATSKHYTSPGRWYG